EKVKQLGADIGLALDGDGDRLIVCDEKGAIVDGDHLMAICAADLASRRKLKKKTLVATVMSNMGLEKVMTDLGGQLVRANVGDRYVVETMRAKGYNFGGEQSGHLVFLDHNTTGDGILAGLQLLAIMIKKNKPLSELADIMTSYPQVLENVRMSSKITPEQIQGFPEALQAAEEQLGKRGRILVRPSGTEPLIRVMAEGEDEKEISAIALELCDVIRRADRV
ncbi:MAG: phosphoglucosamine mutase, partial [Candidatus Electrothrix sp. AX5]|nr:phosphoglucosamine mutase [Candidatus Electrothrix sp. AX5]